MPGYEMLRLMSDLSHRLVQARRDAGYESARQAADALGISYGTYSTHENGSRGVPAGRAEVYARKFKVSLEWLLTGHGEMRGNRLAPMAGEVEGLPILGRVQAGYWRDVTLSDSETPERLAVAADPRFPDARQYALRVVGDSMDRADPPLIDGSYVTLVDFADSGIALRPGMVVHIERYRGGGQLVENSLKAVEKTADGIRLAPRSSNPKHEALLLDGGDDTEIVVKGVVTGAWQRREL